MKRSLALFPALALGLSLLLGAAAYEDVAPGSWYAQAVDFVTQEGLIDAGGEDTFLPNENATRGTVVAALWRLAGSPGAVPEAGPEADVEADLDADPETDIEADPAEDSQTDPEIPTEEDAPTGYAGFSDLTEKDWYAQAAAWGRAAGIVAGSGGAFLGDAPVTREQLATFLLRYCTWAGLEVAEGGLAAFHDAGKVSDWAVAGVRHAVGLGLITGTTGNRLDPKGATTRAQLAIILQRLTTPAAG